MNKLTAILIIVLISGCGVEKEPKSDYDSAIENLSTSWQELDSIRQEKDFFVKVLDDLEMQKSDYAYLFSARQLLLEMQYLANWQRDIARREKYLAFQHALNVYQAHILTPNNYPFDINSVSSANPPYKSKKPL